MTEKITKEYIASLIQSRRPVVLDIGCYDCKDSLALAALLPNEARFFCFDPDSRSLEYAQRNLGAYKGRQRFYLHGVAVGNVDDRVGLNTSFSFTRKHEGNAAWSASSSLMEPAKHLEVFQDVKFNEDAQEVICVRLDSWYKLNLNPVFIDYVHADVNGAEGLLIEGGLQTLNEKVRFLYIEFQETKLYTGALNRADILDLLPGFEEMGVYDFHGNFGNVLLKNKNI